MAQVTIREALNQAMAEEMARDSRVFLMGEEVAEYNGAYKVSMGLLDRFGKERVIDTPITEEGFTGVGIGAAMLGLRPIVEWMTCNFAIQALDQVINNAAKMRYMSGGQYRVPIVFRGPNGPAEFLAAQHSQGLQAIFAHVPGLKVVAPSNAYDAKGLLKSAIRDDNPVVFLEAELMYGLKGEVPAGEYLVPLDQGTILRPGRDVTIVTYSKACLVALEAASVLATQGIEAEVLDLRCLRPLDEALIYQSLRKTNRMVIVEESWPMASVGSTISHLAYQNCFDFIDAPIEHVAFKDVPMPYNRQLELFVIPSADDVVRAVLKTIKG